MISPAPPPVAIRREPRAFFCCPRTYLRRLTPAIGDGNSSARTDRSAGQPRSSGDIRDRATRSARAEALAAAQRDRARRGNRQSTDVDAGVVFRNKRVGQGEVAVNFGNKARFGAGAKQYLIQHAPLPLLDRIRGTLPA